MTTALVNDARMDERLLKLLVREIALTVSRGTTSGPQDSRHDLGYGKTFNDKQSQRMSNSSFPYTDPDDYKDLEYTDDELEQSSDVADKMYVAKTMDPGDPAKTDPFYFVGGNTTMAGGGGRLEPSDPIVQKSDPEGTAISPQCRKIDDSVAEIPHQHS